MWIKIESGKVRRVVSPPCDLVATIGMFDGIHLGHQDILKQVCETAKKRKLTSAVISFYPHPEKVLRASDIRSISSLRQKILKVFDLGIDNFITIPFSKKISGLSAKEFIDNYLFEKLNVQDLIIGPFATFGKNREWDSHKIKEYFLQKNRQVEIIEPLKILDERISSKQIRKLIENGEMGMAQSRLGRNFSICARVIKGNQMGKKLGFPTANIFSKGYVNLPHGVYVGRAYLKGVGHKAAINLGVKPTINKNISPIAGIEAHLLDYTGDDFYSEYLTVEFLNKIREERTFLSLDDLKRQIDIDVSTVRGCFE